MNLCLPIEMTINLDTFEVVDIKKVEVKVNEKGE